MPRVDESQHDSVIDLPNGEMIEIVLGETPTAGFRWKLVADARPYCSLLRDWYEPPAGPVGGSGLHHWQFRAVQAGQGRIELQYRRPWEEPGAEARTFCLGVHVSP